MKHSNFISALLFAALLLVSGDNALAQGSAAGDRAALVALYDATNGANWIDNTNWKTAAPMGAWSGVITFGQPRVAWLNLPQNGLTGPIPSELGNLSELTALWLWGNQLSGAIPAELGNLTNLTQLWINDNQLTGAIPATLGNLSNLDLLALDTDTGLCLAHDFPLTSRFATESDLPVCDAPDDDGGGPGPPSNLTAVGGDGQVVLSWDAPSSDGGAEIMDYEYRIDRRNPWTSTGSTETTHTVTDLVNGTAYTFEVRAVNRRGRSSPSNRTEATPGVFTLDFAHFANGAGITSDLVFVNLSTERSRPAPTPFHVAIPPIRPALYFYDQEGHPITAETVVDITGDLEIRADGSLSVRTEMEALGELTISTHGQGEVVSGSVKVVSEGPIGGVLRFDLPGIGVAGVGTSQPTSDALFPARRLAGGISTAAALHNPGEEAIGVMCRLMSGGVVLEEVEIPLAANGQEAQFIEEMFTHTDTSDFLGLVRCTAPDEGGSFTGVAVELDAANRIFTTLPVVPVPERISRE